ncbi:putative membrane protein [Roseovarius marisflavi]|uniref:Putative membrane protein n=1 Tax=Roseovarius marisflavi TaxID=1054996 RepID=A0A1M6ZXN7_9RHOB|nr:TIGR01620 family protein [Roseovarius marisflavi]SHL35083.1 putative membrane protein [Roseovarius marisflavi]
MSNGKSRDPVLIELDDSADTPGPDRAPPVPEIEAPSPQGRAMQAAITGTARAPSRLGRAFWALALGLLGAVVSVAAWDFALNLIDRLPILGYTVAAMGIALLGVALLLGLREMAGFARLGRLDALNRAAVVALAGGDLAQARDVVARMQALYGKRDEARWGLERLRERAPEQFDAEALIGLAEAELLTPLDALALREVESAARLVATVTALVPLALADVVGALVANLRMIRRVAEIYGGRAGVLGSWRLARAVMSHLVATGAVAVGDDLISSVAGGGLVSKLSRRFGEGVVNGALTARVGVATIEVCRPLPFVRVRRPSVTGLVKRALTGLFGQG